jgi:hypothetical protein
MLFWCTEGGREAGDFAGVGIAGDARPPRPGEMLRLSVDGDLAPSRDPRRSLMKSLTTVRDDRLRGLGPSKSSFSVLFISSVSRSCDCDLRPLENRLCSKDCFGSGCGSSIRGLGAKILLARGEEFGEGERFCTFTNKGDCFKSRGSKSVGSALRSGTLGNR